jgi:hypothetical protein
MTLPTRSVQASALATVLAPAVTLARYQGIASDDWRSVPADELSGQLETGNFGGSACVD